MVTCSLRSLPNVGSARGEEVVRVEVEDHNEAKGWLPGQAQGRDQVDHLRPRCWLSVTPSKPSGALLEHCFGPEGSVE